MGLGPASTIEFHNSRGPIGWLNIQVESLTR